MGTSLGLIQKRAELLKLVDDKLKAINKTAKEGIEIGEIVEEETDGINAAMAELAEQNKLRDEKRLERNKELTDEAISNLNAIDEVNTLQIEADSARRKQASDELAAAQIQRQMEVAQIISSTIGAAFAQAFDSGKKGADEFLRIMLRALAQIATELIALKIAESLPGPAGLIAGGLFGGFGAAFAGQFQTSPGQSRTIPGPPNQPVRIIAHGGETIGRGGGNVTVIVQGSLFNAEETSEAIRSGLQNLSQNTGRTV